MAFKPNEVSQLLANCKRRCCICYKFCGVNIETHHIVPSSNEGTDDIENAIPLCFECHAEVEHYNEDHPKGRKFKPEELKLHKQQWLDICKNSPATLVQAPRKTDIGALEGLLMELEYNHDATSIPQTGRVRDRLCGKLMNSQYLRALSEGAILLLSNEINEKVIKGYQAIAKVNHSIDALSTVRPEGNALYEAVDYTQTTILNSQTKIKDAYDSLHSFLQYDD